MSDSTYRPATSVLVVERYWPGVTVQRFLESPAGASPARIRALGSILVPEDDSVLSVFIGGTVDEVADLNRRDRLPFIRIVPAFLLLPAWASSRAGDNAHLGGQQ